MNDESLFGLIKSIANNNLEQTKPTNAYFGIVKTINPITIFIEPKIILDEQDLILTNAVKDHYVDITVSHITDTYYGSWDTTHSHPDAGSGSIPQDHKHSYIGRKKILVHNGLKEGEKVLLLMVAHGQKYIIIDRISDHICNGEWI